MAKQEPPIDEDEDLFNFDNARHLAASPSGAPAPKASLAELTAEPVVPAVARPSVAPAQLPSVQSASERVRETRAAPSSVQAPLAQPQAARSSVPTRWLLALAIAVNVSLVGIVWRSMTGMDAALRQVGERIADVQAAGTHEVAALKAPSAWPELDLTATVGAEGEATLATAAAEIQRGEYERARARLYSLLSVIDRFEARLRPNLAARAQVLAADAYREQADAVEREAASPEHAGDFLDEAREEKR